MHYFLGDACQNTFVLFDRLEASSLSEEFLKQVHCRLIEEQKDDALVLFDSSFEGGSLFARLAVLGWDGQIAEFCGNGARVCAAYLFASYPQYERYFLCTKADIYPLAKHDQEIYSIKLPRASFTPNAKFIGDMASITSQNRWRYVEMLEPHLIVQEKLSDAELLDLGRELNQNTDFFPKGINVNAWHEVENGHLFVKTYERGVQRLTRSCGTGSISCAAFYQSTGTVCVSTPGGPLNISLQSDGIELKGPVHFTLAKTESCF